MKENMGVRKSLKSLLKRINKQINAIILRLCAGRKLLVHLYYTFLSGAFQKEQQANLYSRMLYSEKTRQNKNHYLLRRNIHRLEKGLVMVPRKAIFGLDYIDETFRTYEQLVHQGSQEIYNPEIEWAHDVLQQYFSVTTFHPVIDKIKRRFLALEKPENEEQYNAPYKREPLKTLPVTYDAFQVLARYRKSIRMYQPKAVPREFIDQAIAIANLAPSACNRQPYEFRILDQPELVKSVSNLTIGMGGFSDVIPAIVVVVGKLSAFEHEHDRHLIYIDGALASMSFMLALETLGLSSCPVNWPDMKQREQKLAALLGLSPDERPILLITLGYADPDGLVARSQRKAVDEIRRYNV